MFVNVPSRHRRVLRWATPLLVLLTMTVFVWLVTLQQPGAHNAALLRWGTVSGALPTSLQQWYEAVHGGRAVSLVSALFVHAGWVHVLGNMLFLMIYGLPSERAMGSWRFLLLFMLGGALSNLAASALLDSPNRIIVGASGAVSAVIGAYVALFPRASLGVVLPLGLYLQFVRAPALVLIGIWALLQGLFTFVGPAFGAVAWWAHLSGFAFGVVYALASRRSIARRLRRFGA
ncbi:MAG: rhomboid family intramembrane serine protease [Gammaproteobacteria bacterium HGW-Gammaproteobacteria-2]|jgi:membrane associated rhomboid family serine protease|nr:MAG: rhomboid family intramembrane serine protease [Gammaproteobacteria bacterium HGW-Gammaproteobacteria-2]